MNIIRNITGINACHTAGNALRACVLAALAIAVQGCGTSEDAEADIGESSAGLSFVNVTGTNSPFFTDAGSRCKIENYTPLFRCCPEGSVMVGAHFGRNEFRCAKVNGTVTNKFFHFQQRNGMLSCEFGKVMTGYGFGPGEFLVCGTPPAPVQNLEYVDNGSQASSQDAGMHVCRKDTVNPGRFAMSGVHVSSNKFSCFQ